MFCNYMLIMIKKIDYKVFVLVLNMMFFSACSTVPSSYVSPSTRVNDEPEALYVYEDGRIEYNSRFVNKDDVVIYSDGRGGEKAAIKVRVPIHPDFYRDSIIVVRVVNKFDEAITQNETEKVDGVN